MVDYTEDHDKVIALETMFKTMCRKIDKFIEDDAENRKELYKVLETKALDCSNCKVHMNGKIEQRLERSWFMWIFGGTAGVFMAALIWIGGMTVGHSNALVKLDEQLKQVICQLTTSKVIQVDESSTGDCSSK